MFMRSAPLLMGICLTLTCCHYQLDVAHFLLSSGIASKMSLCTILTLQDLGLPPSTAHQTHQEYIFIFMRDDALHSDLIAKTRRSHVT